MSAWAKVARQQNNCQSRVRLLRHLQPAAKMELAQLAKLRLVEVGPLDEIPEF